MNRTTVRIWERSPAAVAVAARGVVRIVGRLRAQLALESPPVRRTLVAVLLVMPGGVGIVFFYLLVRSLRGEGGDGAGLEPASTRETLLS